jgi:hypothetical protein
MSDKELTRELPPAAEQVRDTHAASTFERGVAPVPRSALGLSAKGQHLAMQANYGNATVLCHIDAQRATTGILEPAKKGIGGADRGHDGQRDRTEQVRGEYWSNTGVLSDFFNGVTRPSIEAWNSATHTLAVAERRTRQGSIKNAYMYLRPGHQSLAEAERQSGASTKGSLRGAEHTGRNPEDHLRWCDCRRGGSRHGRLRVPRCGFRRRGGYARHPSRRRGSGEDRDEIRFAARRSCARHQARLLAHERRKEAAARGLGHLRDGVRAGKLLVQRAARPPGRQIEGIGELVSDLGSDVDRSSGSLEDFWSQRNELVTWFENISRMWSLSNRPTIPGRIEGTIGFDRNRASRGQGVGESNLGVSPLRVIRTESDSSGGKGRAYRYGLVWGSWRRI